MRNIYKMILGEFNYQDLYDANMHIAAPVFGFFVMFFVGFVVAMYTSIIIRNYNKLITRKGLLASAMANIVLEEWLL